MALLDRLGRARFRGLLEQTTGLSVAHYARPKNSAGNGAQLLVRAGGHTFVVESLVSNRAAPVALAVRRLRACAADVGARAIPLVVVRHMGRTGAEICRQDGVAWLDLSGNAGIDAPGLRIRIEGRPNRFAGRGRPATAFAPKSSRIARQLLLAPRTWASQKQLAERCSLGPGYVSRIVRRLAELELLERNAAGAVRPADPALLLRAWSEDYAFARHATTRGRVRVGDRKEEDWSARVAELLDAAGVTHAATGLAAARWIAGIPAAGETTFFVARVPPEGGLAELGFREDVERPNLRLAVPTDPGVFAGAVAFKGVRCVSVAQAYLDLERRHPRAEATLLRLLRAGL